MTATGQKQMGFQETNHLTKHRSVGPFRKRGRPGPPSTRVCQDHGHIGPNASSPRGGRENLQHIVLLSGRVTIREPGCPERSGFAGVRERQRLSIGVRGVNVLGRQSSLWVVCLSPEGGDPQREGS